MSKPRTNPFPGLRPFLFHEHELFFGREEQYEQMVAKLGTTRFLAVVGTSGSGKSSLVRAGLLPALYGGLMMSAGSNWRVALFRPKDDPIRELAQSLNHRRVFGAEVKKNGSSLLSVGDMIDWPALCFRLSDDAGKALPNPSNRILELLPHDMRQIILDTTQKKDFENVYKAHFVDAFNNILKRREFYQAQGFEKVTVPGEAQRLLSRGQENLSDTEIQKLNRLLLEASYPQEIAKNGEIQTRITEVSLRRGDLGLVEVVRQAKMPRGENLLIVVDQFEELFRYARISENGPHGNQAAAFVKLLLQAKSQQEIPIYVVLTMRSDYLGDCAKFWDLPEAINEGQYLIPRLTRDQRREAIRGPIKERGADITPQLVNQLLNDMGDSPDQLPILQHALMRTWEKWEKSHQGNEPLDIRHYDAIGRMTEALSRHADEAYNELPNERSREIAEKVFKCLTERGSRNREIRRPTELREIRAITKAKVKEIVSVIDVFRQEGRSFLMPSPKKPLTRHTSIDISHESLIRNWTRLNDWVQEETRAANTYRRLAETAQLYKKGKASLLSELEVQNASKWLNKTNPNQAWASRYHPYFNEDLQKTSADENSEQNRKANDEKLFQSAMTFLEDSRRVRNQERRDEEKQRRSKLKRARIVAGVLLTLMVACFVAFLYSRYYRVKAEASEIKAKASEKRTDFFTYSVNISSAQRAFAEENFATAYNYLKPLMKDEKYGQMRGFEWDLLTKTCAHDMNFEMQHQDNVLAAAFLPDRNALATASADGAIKFWKLNELKKTPDAEKQLESEASLITFSSNGKKLATVNKPRDTIKVWDTNTFAEMDLPIKEKDAYNVLFVQFISFTPDGTKIAGSLMASSPKTQDLPKKMASSPTKPDIPKKIEKIVIWDTSTDGAKPIEINLPDTNAHFTTLAFSQDKKLAIGFSDGSVRLWDDKTRQMSKPFQLKAEARGIPQVRRADETPTSGNSVRALAFSQDQEILVSANNSGIITLWNVKEQKSLPHGIANTYPILSLAFSPDRKILAASSSNGSVKLWDTSELSISAKPVPIKELPVKAVLKGHAGAVLSIAFVPDTNILVSTSNDKTARLWDTSKKDEAEISPVNPDGYTTFTLDAKGEMLAIQHVKDESSTLALADRNSAGLFLWPKISTPDSQPISKEFEDVSSVAFSSQGLLAIYRTEQGKGIIKLWTINNQGNIHTVTPFGKERIVPSEEKDLISASKFSSDGMTLATWSPEAGIRIYDVATGKETVTAFPSQSKQSIRASAFSPDLNIFVQSEGSSLKVYKNETGESVPDSRSFSKPVYSPPYAVPPVNSLAFSSDGKILATGHDDYTVRLWNTATWEKPRILNGHNSTVQALVFSLDDKRLATGSWDGVIKLWDISLENWDMNDQLVSTLKLGRELVTIYGGSGSAVTTLTFAPDRKTLISGYANGKIRIVGPS